MESYAGIPAIWDLYNPDSAHPAEHDLFDLLDKQFPPVQPDPASFPPLTDGVNPQNLSLLSNMTPSSPSDDSSPSPPTTKPEAPHDANPDDPTLKRKASNYHLESEPNNKAQHTSTTRRKSSGQTGKDEQRLLKRKEQNRAAQRAFRERKEKHVKDLEDKIVELEAKNEEAQHENENLRDMLSRLQSENMSLKQSAFTFSMPKESTSSSHNTHPSHPIYPSNSSARSVTAASTLPSSPRAPNPLSWSSQTTFDPTVLSLLEDNMSDNAMRMDLGFGNTALTSSPPFTIIADNPMFTTPAFEPGDMNSIHGVGSSFNNGSTSINNYNFDMNALTSWQTPAQSTSVPESMFDDLFQGYLKSLTPSDIMSFMGSTPSISPIAHASPMNSRLSSAPTSSPSILGQEPLFTRAASSSTSDAENLVTQTADTCVKCPKTKEQCREKIAKEGDSMFAAPIQKDHDQVLGPMISCAGSSFPKTEKNDQNVEVLTAWKSIRSDPMFKDVDITELCHEFTKKACCDGTKVVLEPGAVTEIKDNLSKSRNQ